MEHDDDDNDDNDDNDDDDDDDGNDNGGNDFNDNDGNGICPVLSCSISRLYSPLIRQILSTLAQKADSREKD